MTSFYLAHYASVSGMGSWMVIRPDSFVDLGSMYIVVLLFT